MLFACQPFLTPEGSGSFKLVLATTTSTYDSGLLDFLLPDFEAKYNAKVEVIAVGTGQAITLGERGDVDVILVHARAREDEFVAKGYGLNRQDVMYNDFVVIGPVADPAGIKGLADVVAAFRRMAEVKAAFISRGDESGTHVKEREIWRKAGIEPEGDWYVLAGQGMGAVLTMAQERQAYTLTDRGTYLTRNSTGLELAVLVEGDPILFNPYGVIAVNPEKYPAVRYDLAQKFMAWLTSLETQKRIAQFGREEFGQQLFIPDSEEWRAANQ
ncbi:MAG: substrate-binding domain-containing protein [Anaerolineae bacterium]